MMGDRGRLVIPVELRERLQLKPGSPVVLLDTPAGVVLASREQLKQLVRAQLRGVDLVGELLSERRRLAAIEDEP